jgi:hypothetical protein
MSNTATRSSEEPQRAFGQHLDSSRQPGFDAPILAPTDNHSSLSATNCISRIMNSSSDLSGKDLVVINFTSTNSPISNIRSRRKRGCDACRRRKIRCVILEGASLCDSCERRAQDFAFVQSPLTRKRKAVDSDQKDPPIVIAVSPPADGPRSRSRSRSRSKPRGRSPSQDRAQPRPRDREDLYSLARVAEAATRLKGSRGEELDEMDYSRYGRAAVFFICEN